MGAKYLCIHGHFYQPPRENPWLGIIETQASARPYHDWNERIARECYGPNARARVLGDMGRIVRIINNYSYMSFNFGPTLLSWMEKAAPGIYQDILAADRKSVDMFDGHGSAVAQVYNHMIMPLANTRDQATQIRWGMADFERRFGRKAEGMWLAETAVCSETLRLMAEEGVRFTILAPNQAQKIRPLGSGEEDWQDVSDGSVDPRRPYRVLFDDQGEKYIDVFFYDGPTSRAVAFERLLTVGSNFLTRIQGAFGEDTDWPRLVNLATDGESYGHHFSFGEMALAWVFDQVEKSDDIQLINYAAFLDRFPPEWQAAVVEDSSWSCAHGVERWRSDCGCHVGGREGWNQKWRTPLRDGLNWLRDELDKIYENEGGRLLKDPWAARDAYVHIILENDPEKRLAFAEEHGQPDLGEDDKIRALSLLESQLMALYMFTSCGWFFDDISGLEPIQDLKYAMRAMELVYDWNPDLENGLLEYLAKAESNLADYGNGADIFKNHVVPSRTGPSRILAHFALGKLVDTAGPLFCPVAEKVKPGKTRRLSAPGLTVLMGDGEVKDSRTGRVETRSFLAMYDGRTDLLCRVGQSALNLNAAAGEIKPAVEDASIDLVRDLFGKFMPESTEFNLESLIPDTRNRLLHILAGDFFDQLNSRILDGYETHREVLSLFREVGEPLPYTEQFIFLVVIRDRLEKLMNQVNGGQLNVDGLRELALRAKQWGVPMDEPGLSRLAVNYLDRRLDKIADSPDEGLLREVADVLHLTRDLNLPVDLWGTQNRYVDLRRNEDFMARLSPEQTGLFDDLGRQLDFKI